MSAGGAAGAEKSESDIIKVFDVKINEASVKIENTEEDNFLKQEQLFSFRHRLASIREEMVCVAQSNAKVRRNLAKLHDRLRKEKKFQSSRIKDVIDHRKPREKMESLWASIDGCLSTVSNIQSKSEPNSVASAKESRRAIEDRRVPVGPYISVNFSAEKQKVFYVSKGLTFGGLLNEVQKYYMTKEEDFYFLVDNTGVICPNLEVVREFCFRLHGDSWLEREVHFFALRKKANKFRMRDLSEHGAKKQVEQKRMILEKTNKLAIENNPFHDKWLKQMFCDRKEYMHSFVSFIIFLAMFTLTAIYRRDIKQEQNGVMSVRQQIMRPVGVFGEKQFTHIETEDDFWAWMSGPFRDMFFPSKLYNGADVPAQMKAHVSMYNKLAGKLRLRQLRVNGYPCKSTVISGVQEWVPGKMCYGPYSEYNKASMESSVWMKKLNESYSKTLREISFLEQDNFLDKWTSYLYGQSVKYDGSGWINDIDISSFSRQKWGTLVSQMRASNYIDKQTRAVIVDFNLYLPNTDNFVASIVLFEFTAGGAVIPTLKIKPWSRINYDDYSQWVPAFLEIALCAFYGYFGYHEVMRFFAYVKRRGQHPYYEPVLRSSLEFIFSFWNMLEIAIASLYITSIVPRFRMFFDPVRRQALPWKTHVNLFDRAETYATAFKLDGVLTLLVLTKGMKFAGLSPRFNLMRLTLTGSAPVVSIFNKTFS
jgi:hypothetical protein